MRIGYVMAILILLGVSACGEEKDPSWIMNWDQRNKFLHGDAVVYLKFDETSGSTAWDSGSGNHQGDIYNAVRVAGKVGNALQFGSSGARVEVNMMQESMEFVDDRISMDAWIKLDTVDPAAVYHIVGSDDGGGIQCCRLQLNGGKLEFQVVDQTGWNTLITGSQSLSSNTWYYVALTYDGATARTYIDGVQDNEQSISFKVPVLTNWVSVGAREVSYGSFNREFPGIIDEVRYSNTLLSAEDIAKNYEATK